jgi:hypothetical protein
MIGLETRSLLVEDRILKDFDWFVEENLYLREESEDYYLEGMSHTWT